MPSVFLYADNIAGQQDTPVIVGDADTLWEDADDGTYTQCVGQSKVPFDAGYDYRSDMVEGALDTLDSGITPTAIIVHLRAGLFETSSPSGGSTRDHAFLYIHTSDFSVTFNLIDDDVNSWGNTSITDYAIDLADPIPNTGGQSHYDWTGVSMAELADALKNDDVILQNYMPNYTGAPWPSGIYYDRFRIYEWYLEIQYEGASVRPRQRLVPRDDFNRVWPPSRSRSSNRPNGYL